ncbi:NADP oxidoreductase [Conexibacter sp. JD483]|uniref:NAD(P)-binding protein n=1 Tax=unclassified Conexibacter TaxID=2627773 RepID=UPI00271A0F03|nr:MULTISPECIES: NAD(P)-binding protein [unclassified Conexibacter]MDO8187706.1 NADP oxidoreductase [Conexibacter sp. CPCC 205706]MDO8200209.1 NADP oxidoreductase [Conexibacter sp. CPCC 205762]MDR9369385.1 NADP oxidoreductase [Conexibacter sp. JD483]
MRIAIVGAGPSGFFAAGHLLGRGHEVDLFDRLPTPWGLVRGGVAPDHPNIKSVSRVFEKIAGRPGFRFFGNVEIGSDVSHEQLLGWYDAVVYSVGTAIDRRSGVPGEELPGSHSATEFVGWYNGHPDYRDHDFDLSGERAIVIGNGNVAIDVARMLTLTHEELIATDAADHAIEALDAAGICEIVVLGRRGPHQAAFTNPELLELGELRDADVVVDPFDLQVDDAHVDGELDEVLEHTMEILGGYAARTPGGKRKRVVLKFLSSPVALLGDGRVEAVRVVRNRLERDAGGTLRARGTGLTQEIPAGIVFRAIGYQGVAVPGVPFDATTGLIPNDGRGRVAGAERTYVAGWIKRGPSGVIGTNKRCAIDTVKALLEDAEAGLLARRRATAAAPADEVERELRARVPDLVDQAGWESIDAAERAAGEPAGRPRVKLTTVPDLLDAAGAIAKEAVR